MQHRRKYQARSRAKGFTLIELMIVVAVIAIIAAIALPSYNSSVLKSKRAIGKGELMEVLTRQEQYFVNNKAYALTMGALGYGGGGTATSYLINDQGEEVTTNSIYRIEFFGTPTSSTFTIQAVPQNNQAADDCGTMQLSHTGAKSPAECW